MFHDICFVLILDICALAVATYNPSSLRSLRQAGQSEVCVTSFDI